MAETERIETGYKPRDLQEVLHSSLKRFNVLVCHRRFGKTVFVINEMIDQALRCDKKNPQYIYFAPYYGQAKRIAWDYLKEFTRSIPGVTTNEAELRVDIPRGVDRVRIMLLGADNPAAIRGIYLDGVALDEYAEMDPTIWTQVIRPALADRLGWAIFIGTPKGENHFKDLYEVASQDEDWFTARYKASQTGIIQQSELDAAKKLMTGEEYDQEFECSFAASVVGAYYKDQISDAERENRITAVPHDRALQTYTFWDLGVRDSTSIWFVQLYGNQIRLIDYYENSGKPLDHYVKKIKELPYIFDEHTLPHDAAARSLETGRTRQQMLTKLGLRRTYVQKRHSFEDGVNAARMILSRCYFDEKKCEKGILALKSYRRKWDNINKVFMAQPLHNWASNGSDAFRYLAMGVREEERGNIDLPKMAETEYDIFNYGG